MSGLDDILNLIDMQQKEAENSIIQAALKKAETIKAGGEEKATNAYNSFMKNASADAEKDYENACSSADAEMKRRILNCKVKLIDKAVEKVLFKLDSLPPKEYFDLVLRFAERHIRPEKGNISLGKNDLSRITPDFESRLNEIAKIKGGDITLSEKPADIESGFILSYGLISENCSFRSILESEKDSVRDTAASFLFR